VGSEEKLSRHFPFSNLHFVQWPSLYNLSGGRVAWDKADQILEPPADKIMEHLLSLVDLLAIAIFSYFFKFFWIETVVAFVALCDIDIDIDMDVDIDTYIDIDTDIDVNIDLPMQL